MAAHLVRLTNNSEGVSLAVPHLFVCADLVPQAVVVGAGSSPSRVVGHVFDVWFDVAGVLQEWFKSLLIVSRLSTDSDQR